MVFSDKTTAPDFGIINTYVSVNSRFLSANTQAYYKRNARAGEDTVPSRIAIKARHRCGWRETVLKSLMILWTVPGFLQAATPECYAIQRPILNAQYSSLNRISCRKLREGFRRVGFLAGSSRKVFHASETMPEARGRLTECRISCRKLREGFLRVGFLAGSLGEGFRHVENLAGSSGKVSDAKKTLPEVSGKISDAKKTLPEVSGKISDVPGSFPQPTDSIFSQL
jgi:hypothetical protein